MVLIQAVIETIRNCPVVLDMPVMVEVLPEKEGMLCLSALPETDVVQQYADGGSLRQFAFLVSMRGNADVAKGGYGVALLCDLGVYLTGTKVKLPALAAGKKALRFEVLETPCVVSNTYGSFRCEMKCRFIYYQEGDEI